MKISPVSPETLAHAAAEFHALVRDAVEHGASIGFTLPLADGEVADFWRKVGAELGGGNKVLLAARASWRVLASKVPRKPLTHAMRVRLTGSRQSAPERLPASSTWSACRPRPTWG